MRALNLRCINPATILFFMLPVFCAPFLSAQARPASRLIRHHHTIAFTAPLREEPTGYPLVASFSRIAVTTGPERPWESEPQLASFGPPESFRQPVNFNLLLAPSFAKFPLSTTNAEAEKETDKSASDRVLIIPVTFASTSPAADRQSLDRFNDPQYYTRHIPGVGPLVDRVLKQSKAHPLLTRVLKSIQPQF